MATLNALKRALQQVDGAASLPTRRLSETEYSNGFDLLVRESGWATYRDFIIPQLSLQLTPLLNSRGQISVFEIGPGPKSVLGYMPSSLKRKITNYTALEPNELFATSLEEWLCSEAGTELPLPCLQSRAVIHKPFTADGDATTMGNPIEKYDVVLFCHSMYGMSQKHNCIQRAIELLNTQSEQAFVIVFHRDASLRLDGLVSSQTTSFPDGVIHIGNDDKTIDSFASFISGFMMRHEKTRKAVQTEWRKVCRGLGRQDDAYPNQLLFTSPEIMMTFGRHATKLPELMANVPVVKGSHKVKNREALLHFPAVVARPTVIQHVQQCVHWALEHGFGLTIVGGGHSGHCRWPSVVSVDMSAFNNVNLVDVADAQGGYDRLAVVEAGCKTGDIIRKTLSRRVTVPLGARPSVGAGLWLQGGIGHLARLYGLGCDSILGAVVVSVETGEVLCIGHVPSQHQPAGAIRPRDEPDWLWALKGAGTNFGIVISVTFKTSLAQAFLVQEWAIPLRDDSHGRLMLQDFDKTMSRNLTRDHSVDAYLYCDAGQLHLGVTLLGCASNELDTVTFPSTPAAINSMLGPAKDCSPVDAIALFGTEMYMGMHGGHGGGKTSSFKRCVFLNHVGTTAITDALLAAMHNRPSSLCYFHLLHGGGAVTDIANDATAFGRRDWDFACVVTGVWPRDQDETSTADAAVRWVYSVVHGLLPMSSGVYGADLGPDPRDAILATRAFGPNRRRLANLKRRLDPRNVLAYACPLPEPDGQKLIVLVTGDHGAGKDYCAEIWASVFKVCNFSSHVVGVGEATKREYAAATGADLERLLQDRAYKEEHRHKLKAFYKDQLQQRPELEKEHFIEVVQSGADADVLFITGMREEAPVATLSHLVSNARLLDVRVAASDTTRLVRRGFLENGHGALQANGDHDCCKALDSTFSDYRPSLLFDNDTAGGDEVKDFAQHYLLPFLSKDLHQLASMVRSVPDYPQEGINFCHVLNICQQQAEGLSLCVHLLHTHFSGDWAKVDAIACCEAGGTYFASPLGMLVKARVVPIRAAGKLPPPTISVFKSTSHISSHSANASTEENIEMNTGLIHKGASIVVVDDVFATGKTLLAVLKLLVKAGVDADDISVMVVAEFPAHRGRQLLLRCGFGGVHVQSLLVFEGK
ncbi:hypothetical protein F66182_3412 [Fusarium sp. NRRL 66182]|nr:hypothetical protein F66182_3412 [Fusarium sp. NRRL 66182]